MIIELSMERNVDRWTIQSSLYQKIRYEFASFVWADIWEGLWEEVGLPIRWELQVPVLSETMEAMNDKLPISKGT